MIRIFTDFQAVDPDGGLFILKIGDQYIDECAESLNINVNDKVILDAHEDFEVIGTLSFKFIEMLKIEGWIAYADWSTRSDKRASRPQV